MTTAQVLSPAATAPRSGASIQSVPRQYLDPPDPLNPTLGLFLGGYLLAGLSIWGWFVGHWPLPLLLVLGFLALHLELSLIHI